MSVSDVSFNEDILVVTVDSTAPPEVAVTPAPVVVEIAGSGLQGPVGPAGPSGPTGPAFVPNFYETSNPPLGANRGDQWIVTTNIGGN